jgi:hypothetical protein
MCLAWCSFIGGKDMDARNSAIASVFAMNRSIGALGALANEPGARHEVGGSLDLARMIFEDVLSVRKEPRSGRCWKRTACCRLKDENIPRQSRSAHRSFDLVAS